jgi:hypothetical protein
LWLNANVHIGGNYVLPFTDGTANQVLTTDGAGAVTWESPGGGFSMDTCYDSIKTSHLIACSPLAITASDSVLMTTPILNVTGIIKAAGGLDIDGSVSFGSDTVFVATDSTIGMGTNTGDAFATQADRQLVTISEKREYFAASLRLDWAQDGNDPGYDDNKPDIGRMRQ